MSVRKAKTPAVTPTIHDFDAYFEGNEIFKNAFQYSAIGMALVSLEGKWLKVNRKVCDIVGYSEEELSQLTFQDITHPEDLDSDLNYLQQVIANEIETYNMEKRYFHKNGQIVWVLLSVSLARDNNRNPLFFISQIEDITERKLASDKLIESEKRYRNFFDNSPIPLWEEDFSEVKKRLDLLKAQGVTDFRSYFASYPDILTELASVIKILDINQAALKLYGANSIEELIERSEEASLGEIENNYKDFIAIAEGKTTNQWDGTDTTLGGEALEISLSWSVVSGHEHDYSRVIVTTFDITQRKRAEQALRDSELFAHSTLDALSAHIAVLDKNGIIIAVNQAWHEFAKANSPIITNVSEGANYLAVCDSAKGAGSEGAKEMAAGIRAVMRGDAKEFTFEYPCHALNENRWFNLHVTRFGDEENRQVVIAHENITERVRAQQELQKSEERYKSIIEDMPMMMCRFKPDGTLTFINAFYCQYFKKSYEELLGSNLFDLVPEEEREVVRQKYLSLTQENPFVTYEYKTVDSSGNVNWQKWTDRALFNEKGEIIEYQSIGEDITENKIVEEKIRKSEEYYRRLTENFPNGIVIICDQDFRFMFLSGGEIERYNINPQKYLGKTFQEALPAEVLEKLKPYMNAALNGEKDTFELPYLYNSFYLVNFAPLLEADGSIKEILIVAQNITEQKQADKVREESEQRYRSLFEDSPISLWEDDYSAVKQKLDELKQEGVTDFNTYFAKHPEKTRELASLIKIVDTNQYSVKLFNAKNKTDLLEYQKKKLATGFVNPQEFINIANGITQFEWEGMNQKISGELISIKLTWSVSPGYEDDLSKVIISIIDTSEQKQAEKVREESEQRYRSLFEDSPISLWEEDFSGVKKKLNELKQAGVKDFEAYFSSHPEVVLECASLVKILNVNKASVELYNAKNKVDLTDNMLKLLRSDDITHKFKEELIRIANGETHFEREEIDSSLSGEPLVVSIVWSVMPGYEDDLSRVIVSIVDITERKKVEEERRTLIEQLGERVKELTFLHYISRIFMDDSRPEAEILQEVANAIPNSLQYPEITVARVGYNGYQYITPNFKETNWMLSEFFDLPNGEMGFVQFAYLEERPQADDGPFLMEERKLLEATVEKLRTYLRGTLSNQAIHRQLTELETLYESGLAISQLLTPQEIAQEMIGVLARKMEWNHIAIREYDAESNSVKLIGFSKPDINPQEAEEHIQKMNSLISNPSQGLSGWVTTTGKSIRVANVKMDDRYVNTFDQITSGVYVPLKIGERVIGSISVESELENAFSEQDERMLVTLAGQAAIAIENANLFSKLETELFQRQLIEDEVRQLNAELENRVEERTLQIEATKRRLELATHAGQIGVWEYIPKENKVIWDERMYMIHHVHTGEFEGTSESWAKYIHPHDVEKSQINTQFAFTENLLLNNEHRIIWPDGTVRFISTSATPVFSEDGNKPDRVIGICIDITDNKKFEEALKLTNAEMENALQVKDEFLANMSHELRTPLNAILGISESLEEQIIGKLNEKQSKYVGIIKESGRHLLELINDILDISKIEAGRMELDFHAIGVEKLCQASLRMIKELAQKKNIQVSFKLNGEVKTIMGDERRLKQVLVNLLSNAVKFTAQGKKIGLEVNGYPEKNEVTFSVWDTGIGIAQEDLKYLFKPFVQLDAGLAREYQGTGLGLALVAQMVRLHGGLVSANSEPNKGSTFTITLPWQPEEQNTPVKFTSELVLPNQKSEEKRKGRILLVEDTDVIISLIKDYLTFKGYEVIVANNGREGISLAKEKQPDIILMDVMMPIMDGVEATKQIRAEKKLRQPPIIALTALAMHGDRERCLEAGMTDYMSKPVKLNELTEMIEKHILQG